MVTAFGASSDTEITDCGMIKSQPNYADFETETAFVSETKFVSITIDGGMDKGTAFRRAFCRKYSIILRLLYKS